MSIEHTPVDVPVAEGTVVFFADGQRGSIERVRAEEAGRMVRVRTPQGLQLMVPETLITLVDGELTLPFGSQGAALQGLRVTDGGAEALVIPLVAERAVVSKQLVDTALVRVTKRATEHEEQVDLDLRHEDVVIERVPLNVRAEEMTGVRTEGDTTIVPIYEEVLFVEKRLMLREEVRISRRVSVRHEERTVSLRGEDVEVDRLPIPSVVEVPGASDSTPDA